MSREKGRHRAVRARRDEEEDYGSDASENEDMRTSDEESDNSGKSSLSQASTSKEDFDVPSEEENTSSALKDISFGVLAKAQDSFAPPPRLGKRKRTADPDSINPRPPLKHDNPQPTPKSKPPKPSSRTSKHAPQTLSTRYPVSRSRTIFSPSPALKSLDPRFNPTVITNNPTTAPLESAKANKNYSFLTSYRQSELQSLQSRLKTLQTPPSKKNKGLGQLTEKEREIEIASVKREIQSLTSKLAASAHTTREREIRAEHKRKEKEAIREGRKSRPFYLKKGEVRRQVEGEVVEGMGKRAREKREVRKRKRELGREGKGMPRVRRSMGGGGESG